MESKIETFIKANLRTIFIGGVVFFIFLNSVSLIFFSGKIFNIFNDRLDQFEQERRQFDEKRESIMDEANKKHQAGVDFMNNYRDMMSSDVSSHMKDDSELTPAEREVREKKKQWQEAYLAKMKQEKIAALEKSLEELRAGK